MQKNVNVQCQLGLSLQRLLCLAVLAIPAGALAAEGEEKPWSLSVNGGLEYDDNVTVTDQDVVSDQSDTAAVFDLSASYQLDFLPDTELEAGYDLYASQYFDLSEFDLVSHSLSLNAEREINGLDAGIGYRFVNSTLDGDDFLQIHSLQPTLGFSLHESSYTLLKYNYQDKAFDDLSSRDADHHAFGVDNVLLLGGQDQYANLGYRYEVEDAQSAEFDYTGHVITLGGKTPIGQSKTRLLAGFSYQYWLKNYDHLTASIGKDREDKRHTLSAEVSRALVSDLTAKLQYQYINNISNLPSNDYTENLLSLTLGAEF